MGFQFRKDKRTVHLDIAGNAFTFAYDGETMTKMQTIGRRLTAYGNDPATDEDTPEDAAYFVYDCIDELLGAGASDKIFAGREPDYLDALEVVQYIVDEINRAVKRPTRTGDARQHPPQASGGKHYNGKHRKRR